MTSTGVDVGELAGRLRAVGFPPDLDPAGSQFVIRLYRRLVQTGEPIPATTVEAVAVEAGLEAVDGLRLIAHMVETDAAGAVHGVMGLSLNANPHTLRVAGRKLSTWCALDPLFIVPILGGEAEIESTDPTTGRVIRIVANTDEIMSVAPVSTVMSVVVPAKRTESIEDTWSNFCHVVYFFEDRAGAAAFFDGRDNDVTLVTMAEAWALARDLFVKQLKSG